MYDSEYHEVYLSSETVGSAALSVLAFKFQDMLHSKGLEVMPMLIEPTGSVRFRFRFNQTAAYPNLYLKLLGCSALDGRKPPVVAVGSEEADNTPTSVRGADGFGGGFGI